MRIFTAGCFLLTVIVLFSACSTTRNSRYFKSLDRDTTIAAYLKKGIDPKIQAGDNLGISINSLSQEENIKFNSLIITGSGQTTGVPTYNVAENGTIKMHRLGEIPVAGLTRLELANLLQDSLKPYLKEPLVNVSFLNHKITVVGAVARPQVINVPNEGIGLMEVLAMSGDILPDGKKDQVLIIRDSANNKLVKKVNLEDHGIFASEWYYLQPNDVVYVVADTEREEKEARRRRVQTTLSLAVSGVSLLVIIIDRLLR